MKNSIFKSALSILFLVLVSTINAQTTPSTPTFTQECLGIHYYVNVDLQNDPVVNGGFVKYTIPVPREGLDYIHGPLGCYLSNHLGNTVDVYVRKIHLELALSDYPSVEVPFELYVNKWITYDGATYDYPVSGGTQCFYYVVFKINSIY